MSIHKALHTMTNQELSSALTDVSQYSVLSDLSQQVLKEAIRRCNRSGDYNTLLDVGEHEKNSQCAIDLNYYAGESNSTILQVLKNYCVGLLDENKFPSDIEDHKVFWEDIQEAVVRGDVAGYLQSGRNVAVYIGAGPLGPKTADNWAIVITKPWATKPVGEDDVIVLTKLHDMKPAP